jgi:hypothetical protein
MALASLPLSLGALVGIALSGGFVWYEVGRYATPQVPVTLFDERRELFAYTAGLFVGVPIAIAYLLFILSMANGALAGALLFLALLVASTEVAQWALLRSRFWGRGESGPFYALGYRAAIGGIVALALVTQYFGTTGPTVAGIVLVVLDSVAVVALEVAGALLSVRAAPGSGRIGGGPVSGAIFGAVGFFLLGLGAIGGLYSAYGGALVALLGAGLVYRRLRPILASIPAPSAGPPPPPPVSPPSYGRTDRASAPGDRVGRS